MSLHGSHIDLGQLASAASNGGSGSTATTNPMFGAVYNADTEQWEDPSGTALKDEHQKALNDASDKGGDPYSLTKNPYVTPSWSDKVFHPDIARQEADYNNAWNLQGPAAQHTQDVTNDVNTKQAGLAAPAGTSWDSMTPAQKGIATAGRFDSPSILAAQSAGANIAQGNPLTEALNTALHNTATKRNLIASLGNNLPEKESQASVTGADALTAQNNNAITTAQATAPFIKDDVSTMYGNRIAQNTNDKMRAEGIRPSIPNLATIANNQAQREADAIPTSNKLYGSNLNTQLNDAEVQEGLSGVRKENLAGLKAETQNQTLNEIRNSYHLPPPQNPLGVTPIGALERTPTYAPMMQTVDAKLGIGGGATGGFSPTLSSGLSIGPSAPQGQTNAPSQPSTQQIGTPINPQPKSVGQRIGSSIGSGIDAGVTGATKVGNYLKGPRGANLVEQGGRYIQVKGGKYGVQYIHQEDSGMYEKNADGTFKLDSKGYAIPKATESVDNEY